MISLYEIDFSNLNFWIGFIATSFPTALEEETDMSLTELITENGMCDSSDSIQKVIKLYKRQTNISFIIAFSGY